MHYSAYKSLSEDLNKLETLSKYYSGIHRYQFTREVRATLNTKEAKEKIEKAIFEIVCRVPKHLPAITTELHINAIEDPMRCKKYIDAILQLLSMHITSAKIGLVKSGEEHLNQMPAFGAEDDPEGDLLFSELISIAKPDYEKIKRLRWTALYVLLLGFESECNYRLSEEFYETLDKPESADDQTHEDTSVKANSINEKLVFIKEIGIYELLTNRGLNNENIARTIGYLVGGNPNTISPLLTKITYKKPPQTGKKDEVETAKKNNPYTKRAIINAFETLTRLGLQQSSALTNAYLHAVTPDKN